MPSRENTPSADTIIQAAAKVLTSLLPTADHTHSPHHGKNSLKLPSNADAFEIFYSKSRSLKIESKDLKVETLTSAADIGLSFRVQKNGRVGFSYTTSIEPQAIESAIRSALDISAHMPVDESKFLTAFDDAEPLPEHRFDEAALQRKVEEKMELAFRLEKRCKELDARIQTVRTSGVTESESEVILYNSRGQHLRTDRTLFTASISCKAEENGDAQMGGDHQFAAYLKDLPIEVCAENAAETATEHLGATIPATRVCPGIIRNNVVADLLEFLATSFFGEEIQKGRSMLKGKLGETLFSKLVTIVDDGRLPHGYASRPFDGEGTTSQTTPVIEGGKFSRMLLDKASALHFGLPSTGNSSRGLKSPPMTSISNLYLKAGPEPFDTLVKTMGDGVIITDLMGVHTANAITGSFSLGATGLLVEKGKITKPIKGFALAGNVLDLFRDLTSIGSDLRFFGNIGGCSILLPEVSVSGA